MANFDKQVKKQAESFSLEPRKEVWKSLEVELDKTKKRRFAEWVWVLPIMLIAGAAIFYYSTTRKNKPVSNQSQTEAITAVKQTDLQKKPDAAQPSQNIAGNTNRQPVNTANKNAVDDKANTINQHLKSPNKNVAKTNSGLVINNKKEAAKTTDTEVENHPVAALNKKSAAAGNNAETVVGAAAKVTDNNIASTKNDVSSVKQQEINTAKSNANIENTIAELKTVSTDKTQSETIKSIDKNISVAEQIKQQNKRVKWRFVMAAGISNNAEAYGFLKQKRTPNDSDLANSVPPGLFEPMEKSKPGLSLSLSIKRSQWLNKRWQWQASAGAQLQQEHQYTGIRYDDPIVPSPDNFYSADYFFESGKIINHTGNNYRVFVTNNVGYSPFKKLPGLLVNVGVTVGANIYDRYLLADSNFVLYIRSDEYYRKFFAGVNLGTAYTLKNGFTMDVTANHDFNKSFRPLDKNNHYWRSLQFSIGIPLSDKNKGR
ncbi:hypothetical protein BH10BAC3_BH10BAC3_22300 [soil metagenome]